jgi:phosphopantothenoylcysteine synthetase/decarboxylase
VSRPKRGAERGGGGGAGGEAEAPRVLYAIVCGSPPAREVGRLVDLARNRGWDVCVICTPDGLKFVDVPGLAARTGHPVRVRYKNPGDLDVLPAPSAIVVAPATVNTINKWALGIADTLALGLIVEAIGLGLPIVTIPYTNSAMAAHPAFAKSISRLRSWGVTVLYGDDVIKLHPPRAGDDNLEAFPWHLAVEALPA